tara:strand:+ start:3155 stop:4540 length:1386 start_codon:yes stop_codon:yes gene_type:complete
MSKPASEHQQALREAWDDMIQALESARDAIDSPELMPPPPSDRNLAEGYRYLMGYVHAAVERAFHSDTERPQFRNALSVITRSTIDNADAIYFYAPIDGAQSYRVSGVCGDTRHWRGEEPVTEGPKAPHYMIFEATSGALPGDTGSLMELKPGVKAQTGRLDSSSLVVADDGRFEILLAPEKPAGYSGNFICTSRQMKSAEGAGETRYANYLSGRQLFGDWACEEAVHLEIVQLGAEGTHAPAYNVDTAVSELRQCGEIVRNQMHFWNAFWTILMGTYGEREGSIPGVAFPRNAFNKINAASVATGGGQSTNLYAGGVYELGPDEALIIENRVQTPPQYIGFQIGNLWGESIEYANQIGSLNGQQMQVDADGVRRIVIAHRDPGVPNWVDTTGHPEGFMTARWAYSEKPAEDLWPGLSTRKVAFDEIRQHLPADTPTVKPDERREQIAVRQRHVQKRYRMF